MHPVCEQRMAVGVIRIILAGIVLAVDAVCRKVEKETGIPFSNGLTYEFVQLIILDDLFDHQESTRLQTSAAL